MSLLIQVYSIAARDALSKALYDRVFRWIVNQINHLLAPNIEDYYMSRDIGIVNYKV